MVEMLGTLAIMGILSLAGIWAYNAGMDSLRANTLINEAQKRAVVVAGQINMQGRTNPSLAEFTDNTFGGGTFGTEVVTTGLYQQFGVQVSNVSKRVCQNILNAIGDTTPIRRLAAPGNPTTAITSCTDTNTFLMVYNNNMSSSGSDTTYASEACGCQTVCGQCIVDGAQTRCVSECPVSPTQCTQNSQCTGDCVGCVIPEGETQGTCQACQRVEYLESTGTQYIDTRIKVGSDTRVFTVLKRKQLNFVFSFSIRDIDRADEGFGFGINASQQFISDYNGNRQTFTTLVPNTTDIITVDKNKNVCQITIGNNSETKINTPSFFTTQRSLIIFGQNRAGTIAPTSDIFYSFKIWNNALPVRDFIPVHAPFKTDGKQNCMFDRVSKELFCNAGTGDFLIPSE